MDWTDKMNITGWRLLWPLLLIFPLLPGCGGGGGSSGTTSSAITTGSTPGSSSGGSSGGSNINNGTATLNWVAPTTRLDGSSFSLSELRGYNVYEGTGATNLAQVMNITNPTTTSYTVANLAPGTHYFTVTAYDSTGAASSYSNVVSKVIK